MPDELTTPDSREKLASQIPAVELLMKLGFRYLPPTEALQARGGRKSEVLLTPILREQLTKLNRVRWRGREQGFSPDAIEGAIAALRDLPDEGLIQTSEKVYDLLSLGKSFPQTVEGDIIFDLRGYPLGTVWTIAPRLSARSAPVAASFRWNLVTGKNPADAATLSQKIETTDKPKYTGKTVTLIDDRAVSHSEHTGLFLEAASNTTFIGSPTAGATGEITNCVLPGGVRVSFSGQDIRHADGRQLQRVGLAPHIEVKPTVAGIRAGRDEVLERAIKFIQEGK